MHKFKKENTKIDGLYIIEPNVHFDERGYFFEEYNRDEFLKLGLNMEFVQQNESLSKKNVLRGLHVQKKHPQGKLVRVLTGEIYDVVVDLRENSQTFGGWFGTILSSENFKQLYIPEGFAHGFFVKSEVAKISFKVSDYWHPDNEIGIMWNDANLNIDWKLPKNVIPIITEKDSKYLPITETVMKGFVK